jgi:hypothetical protein
MPTPAASRPSSSTTSAPTPASAASAQTDAPGAARPSLDEPIVVRGADDLVTAVPHLVGFMPERSLVVVAVKGAGRRSRLGLVARFDLPPADQRRRRVRDASPAWVAAAAGEAARVILRDQPEQVVALVFDEHRGGPLPWRRLLDRLEEELRTDEVPVLDLLLVDGGRFWSYRCDDSDCCPGEGRVVPEASAVHAEFAARGSSPLASRAALRDLVAPEDHDRCSDVEATARRELAAVGSRWADDDHPGWRAWQRESVRLLQQVAARYADGDPGVDADEAGRLLAGLCDVTVRDVAVARFTGWSRQVSDAETQPKYGAGRGGEGAGQLSRLDELVAEVDQDATLHRLSRRLREPVLERLWLDLATSADGPLALAPLTALGLHVWSHGNGALAGAVVDRALALDPGYRLAVLLEQALLVGLRPPMLEDDDCGRDGDDEAVVSLSEN